MKILSDGSDLEGVEKTQDIKYIKLLKLSMWIIGAWPREANKPQGHRYYMVILKICCLVPGIIYLRNNVGKLSYFELGHTYITVFMNTVVTTRAMLMLTTKYNQLGLDYLNIMHMFNHRNNSKYAHKMHVLVHKICHFYTIYIICMMANGILLFNLTPLYNSYSAGMFTSDPPKNASFEHSVYYALPFDYKKDIRGYVVVATFNWYISVTCSSYFCIVDLFTSLMVFHLWGHIRVLTYNLDTFPMPALVLADPKAEKPENKSWYNEEESRDIFNKLRNCIQLHSLIIEFSSRMSHTYGEVILVFYLFHQVSGCLLLLECSQMDTKALVRYGPLTVIIFQQLIQVSVIFELLGSSNDKLIDSAYTLPWEYMETKHRKLVFLMLKQSQRSMNLKAMNMVTVGFETMTSIFKTSFSYFIMLRTVADEE